VGARSMKIVTDANILAVERGFGRFGELVLLPGREIQQADLVDADALLVRSITRVNSSLLAGTAVKFVATASSGTDHIDLHYLGEENIGFADAKGSNANAVVDYCFAAIAFALLNQHFPVAEIEVGIIGGGNVGGLFANKLSRLGIAHRIYDPFLHGVDSHCPSLEQAMQCKIVSLHVPLTVCGDYPTRNLIAGEILELLQPGAVLINTCRGSVVDELALSEFLKVRPDITTVFDVWENEPEINQALAAAVHIATPHIAGYSQQAKLAATEQIQQAFQNYFFGQKSLQDSTVEVSKISDVKQVVPVDFQFESELANWATLLNVLPLDELSREFKQSLVTGAGAACFDEFRIRLMQRQEFRKYSLKSQRLNAGNEKLLAAMGFSLP